MRIGTIGYNYIHDSSFLMDRPNGSGAWNMLLIKTNALFRINGAEYHVKPGSFVMFTPEASIYYRAEGEKYTDDWMYFDISGQDKKLLSDNSITPDHIYYLGDIEEISQIWHILAFEHYSAGLFHEEIENHYTDLLLLMIIRKIRTQLSVSPAQLVEKNYRLTHIRSKIFTMPETINGIQTLADEAGMSRSGFQHLYKKMFGTTVITDIISGRLDRAKRLLASTNLTIREISEKCGYRSEYNFMKEFKKRFGKTPTEWRKSL